MAEAAGIEKKVTLHILRSTYATQTLRHGLDLWEVQQLLDHGNIATSPIYVHVHPAALRYKIQAPTSEAKEMAAALVAQLPAELKEALRELL